MATMAEEELGMEPERSPCTSSLENSSPTTDSGKSDTNNVHTATGLGNDLRLRGGFEEGLKNDPVIVSLEGKQEPL
jgi:hypothetical protein